MADISAAAAISQPRAFNQISPTPGPNSWAQAASRKESASKQASQQQPTNRDKYENKPMPRPPPAEKPRTTPKKPYIPPAVPLINTLPADYKKRAVTEPVQQKTLLTSKKPSVSQLRRKFSSSKVNGSKFEDSPPLPHADVPGKAQNVLGISGQQTMTPVPAVSQKQSSNSIKTSSVARSSSTVQAVEPVKSSLLESVTLGLRSSTESEVSRFMKNEESSLGDGRKTPNSAIQGRTYVSDQQDENKIGELRPPKIPTYGNVGKLGVVQLGPLHSSGSFQGIIETASVHELDITPSPLRPHHTGRGGFGLAHQPSGEVLRPAVYSPSIYEGVWQNDPAVGHTLPPFSPFARSTDTNTYTNQQVMQDTRRFNDPIPREASANVAAKNHRSLEAVSHDNSSRSGEAHSNQHALSGSHHSGAPTSSQPSGNSWATLPHFNPSSSSNIPGSAHFSPHWPIPTGSNSVPSPPYSHFDYQRPSPLSAGLAHLDMTLHHHIDSTFRGLCRLVTDKDDHLLDQILTRLDNLEDVVRRGFKDIRNDMKTIKGDIGEVKVQNADALFKGLQRVEIKIATLETHIERWQSPATREEDAEDPCSGEQARSGRLGRGIGSAQGQGPPRRGEERAPLPASFSRSSSKAPTDRSIRSKGHRSNTSTSQPDLGYGIERAASRAGFLVDGSHLGPPPDLRDHPAFAGMRGGSQTSIPKLPEGAGEMFTSHGGPSFDESAWYHRAYGKTGM